MDLIKKQKKSKFQQLCPIPEPDPVLIFLTLAVWLGTYLLYRDILTVYSKEQMKELWDSGVLHFINWKYETLKAQNSLFEFHSKINDFCEFIKEMESPEYFEKMIRFNRHSGYRTEEEFKIIVQNYLEKVWKTIPPGPENSFNKIIDENLETIKCMSEFCSKIFVQKK